MGYDRKYRKPTIKYYEEGEKIALDLKSQAITQVCSITGYSGMLIEVDGCVGGLEK